MTTRRKGTIKRFMPDRNIGFITPNDGSQDVFFHGSSLEGIPTEGASVEFIAFMGDRGPKASEVEVIGEQSVNQSRHATNISGSLSDCVFGTFYASPEESGGEKDLKPEIFFDAPQKAAQIFRNAGLSTSQLRMLFNGFRSFSGRLAEGKISFGKAKELYGAFYAERVVRQNKRDSSKFPDVVVDFFDLHKDVIMSEPSEMRGFDRYLTNILCFFGDKV